MLLPEGTLALHRHQNAKDLPHSAQVLRPTVVEGAGGERTTTYVAGATLGCRATRLGGLKDERLTQDQLRAPVQYRVAFAAGADVRPADRLQLTITEPYGGSVTVLVDVRDVHGPVAAETQRTALCTPVGG